MSISPDLFLAILSMDAYDRGYDRGLDVSSAQIGIATSGADSSIARGANNQPLDQLASFFAQAYTINQAGIDGLFDGQKIISYRGNG
jgi:hypothetical protein